MKRSEIINELRLAMYTHSGSDDLATEHAAKLVLDHLEKLGIQPPAIKEPCETFVLYNGKYVKTEDSFVYVNKWDEE